MASSPSSTAKLHRLSASFVLGYHGCDAVVAERLLLNEPFKPSRNVWDWLGEGIYFWDANPVRGLEFVVEVSARQGIYIQQPAVVGAVIDLGFCLDLTTSRGLRETRSAFSELHRVSGEAGRQLPENQSGGRHNLDCAVINYLHRTREGRRQPFDTVRDRRPKPCLHQGCLPRSGSRSRPHGLGRDRLFLTPPAASASPYRSHSGSARRRSPPCRRRR
jgi:hypothetical protein